MIQQELFKQEGVILHLAELSENLLKCLQSRSFLLSFRLCCTSLATLRL